MPVEEFASTRVLNGEAVVHNVEIGVVKENGALVWINLSATACPLMDWKVVIVTTDITERKQVEEALRVSEARYREFIDATPDLVFVKDDSFRYLIVNHANQSYFGEREVDTIGKTDFDLMPEQSACACQQSDRQALETRHVVITIEQVGEQFFETRKFPVSLGERIGVGGIIRNITAQKKAEESLHLQSTTLNAAANAIVITDRDGTIEWVNSAFTALTGYTSEESLSRNPRDLVRSGLHNHVLYKNLWETILDGQVWHGELINRRKDGSLYTEEQTITPVYNEYGIIAHFIAIKQDVTERKQVEEALHESERFARSTLDGLSAHIAILDEVGTILAVNRSWRDFAEKNPPVAANVSEGANYLAVCDQASGPSSEGAAEFAAAIRAVLSGEMDRFEAEYACHSPDDQQWFVGRVTRFPSEGPIRVVIAHENTTRSKLAELKLAEERNLLRTLIDSLPDRIYAKDSEGRFIFKNLVDTRQIGVALPSEVIGKTDFDYYPPELAAQYYADDQVVLQSGHSLLNQEEPITAADGNQGWILTSKVPLQDDQGNVIGLVGIGRDITERKQMEEALRQERNLLRTLIDTLPDYIFVKDRQGRFVLSNLTHAQTVFQATPADLIGKMPMELYPPALGQQYHADDMWVMDSGERLINAERQTYNPDGTKRWVLTTKVPLKSTDGQIVGLVGVSRDITERKQAEDTLLAHNRHLDALNRVGMALAETLTLPRIFQTAYEHVSQLVDCPGFGISLYDSEARTLRAVFMLIDGEPLDTSRFPPLVFSENMLLKGRARAILVQQPELVTDMPLGPSDHTIIVSAHGDERVPLSALYMPMIAEGKTVGLLEVQSYQENAFGDTDITLLGPVSNQIGLAIENARLFTDLEAERYLLEQRVIERTAQLNHAKERIEAILNSSSDVMILCRIDSCINQVNPAFDESFGCTPDEIYNQPLATLAVPEHIPLLEQTFEIVTQTRQPQRLEITVRYKASATFDGEMMLSPVFGQDSQLIGVICSLRNITERKKMESQLRQMLQHEMEINELKSRYVSMAAHDLRNPLAVIQAAIDSVERYYERMTEAQRQAKYENIRRSIKVMVELLDDTLMLGQVESGKLRFEPRPLDLIRFSQDLTSELQQATGGVQRIRVSHHGVCDRVEMDAKLLRHILGNLLSNAVKYSPDNSMVTLDIQCESDMVTFCIRDQGIGIPKAAQGRLFETFHRAENVGKTPGTGLGLAIVKQSVTLHEGTITFESEEGFGTTFTVILPQVPIGK
jgi:PAS domain S-box-containing protein